MTPSEVVALAKEQNVKIVDLKFMDLPGMWQHFSIMVDELSEDLFTEGIGFDGSSIRGFQAINESDMLLFPDPATALVDPVCKVPTLSITCNIKDPITLENYTRDVRHIAQKAESYLQSTGLADISYWGPEAEFYLLNDIRYAQNQHSGFYFVDSVEGSWNSGKEENPNLGYKPRYKEGYFPVPPSDTLQDIRSEICLKLIESGVDVEVHHHEVGTAGQGEIDIRFDTLTTVGDKIALYKYIVKNVARSHNLVATFMPKPLFQDNGSGMHVHTSLWKDGKNIFFDSQGYSLLSETALYYIGGLLKHARSLCAIIAPTTNSYKRLVPGYEAPVNIAYSQRNRSACVRIPVYSKSEKAKRVEFRTPDPSCNPYLAFSALLMAGLDGIQNRIHPGDPLDKDLYDLEPEELDEIESTPASLGDALDALEDDHEYLLKGDVFTEDVIDVWLEYKRENEVDAVNMRPHPYEFFLYHDI
ncbi:type I glutamate--ammonia ligase [Candidatus Poribacteria bacterium]|nr:type I glutamate--ammonia ligase [Candidatus Poribacteria bacterium]MYB66498.1 type I glutamate--ammonia ligase [Candidatus Poribacteria bacterium]MYF56079.1 type I glutamate--ammonia ligase [Candidatus Poribacteria bacterium]MYI95041.1 type I glutamate--ammonia ligase [Candidatus Poribacteria bacterium]